MSSDNPTVQMLLEMGFPPQRVEKALRVSGDSLEAAMEWLLAHSDDPDIDIPLDQADTPECGDSKEKMPDENEQISESSEKSETETTQEAKSLQCDECGKKFRSEVEVEYHVVKSGHKNFSESAEEVKPLTEDEKQEQLRKLEEKIRQRRLEREEQDRKSAIEKEKLRRKTGQEIAITRQRLQEEEQRREAELRRREKLEAKLAKQKILEEIERDKLARKEMFGMTGSTPVATQVADTTETVSRSTTSQKKYDECKLQIRLTNGQVLNQTFGSGEELAAVRLYVQLNRTDGNTPFGLMTNFPKKVFNDEDMNKPLSALGLVPTAVLIVTKQ